MNQVDWLALPADVRDLAFRRGLFLTDRDHSALTPDEVAAYLLEATAAVLAIDDVLKDPTLLSVEQREQLASLASRLRVWTMMDGPN